MPTQMEPRKQAATTITAKAPALLNLGCGGRFHEAWINMDLAPPDASVRPWDVTAPLPFPDESFDAVYHSHLLEHVPRDRAARFLAECRRVLKPGGIVRIAIPNLEAIARLYLHTVEEAWYGDEEALAQHRWLVMEMYDQVTRETPGGAMVEYLRTEAIELAWYRLGVDGVVLKKHFEKTTPLPTKKSWMTRLRGWLCGSWRERAIRWLLGEEYAQLQIGRFRRSGEVHHWMYDRVSLRALLREAGFTNFRCVGPMESDIPGWSGYHLDAASDGGPCKPDSLFVEATA